MNPDPHADAADDEWAADRLARRIEAFRAQRPAKLSHVGDLDAGVATWSEQLSDGKPSNLLLAGPIGAGKTWAALEALERAVRNGYAGRIMVVYSAAWRDAIAPPVDRDVLVRMRAADVLLLDDLGSGRIGEWEKECLLGVVDERWAHGRPIVLTFNVQSLRETLGERIASRLADGATSIVLPGIDRRRNR
jgi:DNA replication protein DnaC